MSDFHSFQSTLNCQVNILKLRHPDYYGLPAGEVFLRYYIPVGSGRRVRINAKEFPSMSLLECSGTSQAISELIEKHGIVFELRWRKAKTLFKCLAKSEVLGRAEVALKDIAQSDKEQWISLSTTSHFPVDAKQPALLLRVEATRELEKPLLGRLIKAEECGCRDCQWIGSEEDMFHAATTALYTF